MKELKIGNLKVAINLNETKLREEIKQLKKLKEELIHLPTYQLLDGKTQMSSENKPEIRSRLDHTEKVVEIASSIIKRIYDRIIENITSEEEKRICKLNQEKEVLYTEIMGYEHDLGHTPFGHDGERVMNEFIESIEKEEEKQQILMERTRCLGKDYEEKQGHRKGFRGKLSFEHNEQSAIQFYHKMENKEGMEQVDVQRIIKGILSHSISRVPKVPEDLCAQAIRQADKIEYRNEDYEEYAKYIQFKEGEEELEEYAKLELKKKIQMIVKDIVEEAISKGKIEDNNQAMAKSKALRKKYEHHVYFMLADGTKGLIDGNNTERCEAIYAKLLQYYYEHPEEIPTKSRAAVNPINPNKEQSYVISFEKAGDKLFDMIAYVNSFTNKKCIDMYERLVKKRILEGKGKGIEPITKQDLQKRKEVHIEEAITRLLAKELSKTGVESRHSKDEYRQMVNCFNEKYFKEDLTLEAKKKIKDTMEKNRKENERDEVFCELMKQQDQFRNAKSNGNTNKAWGETR